MSHRSGKWRKYVIYGFVSFFTLTLAILSAATLIALTESGSHFVARTLLNRLNQSGSTEITVAQLKGRIFDGIQLTNVEVTTDSFSGSIEVIEASWNPYSLMSGTLRVSKVLLRRVEVALKEAATVSDESTDNPLEQLSFQPLPIDVSIASLEVDELIVVNADNAYSVESFSASLSLEQELVELSDLQILAAPVSVRGRLEASLIAALPLKAEIGWSYSAAILDRFDSAAGQLQLSGNTNLLQVSHQLSTPVSIHSEGSLEDLLGGDSMQADFIHRSDELIVPVTDSESVILRDLSVTNRWQQSALEFQIDSLATQEGLAEVAFSTEGILAQQAVTITEFKASTNTGVVSGSATANWNNGLVSSIDFTLQEQDPLQYLDSDISIDLSQIETSGQLDVRISDGQPRIELQVPGLNGQLGGYPMSGSADLSVIDGTFQINQLQLNAAQNSLSVAGKYDGLLDISWELAAPELSILSEELQGKVIAIGSIAGSSSRPDIQIEIEIENLQTGDIELESFDATFVSRDSEISGTVAISNVILSTDSINERIERAELVLSGNYESQLIEAAILADKLNLDLSIVGGPINLSERLWSGTIDEASIRSQFGHWINTNEAAFSFADQSLVLDESCWQLNATQFCLDLLRDNEGFALQAALTDFPLEEFNKPDQRQARQLISYSGLPRLPQGISLSGKANLGLTAKLAEDGSRELEFSAVAENTDLSFARLNVEVDSERESQEATSTRQSYNWESMTFKGSFAENEWRLVSKAVLNEDSVDESELKLNGLLETDLIIGADSVLTGSAVASFQDIGWVEAFVPQLSEVSGQLQSNLSVSGSLESPVFEGDITIGNGTFTANRLGVTYHDLEATIHGESRGTAELVGRVSGGEGELRFRGDVADIYSAQRKVSAHVEGQGFQFIDVPDLSLSLSPNLDLLADAENIHLSGNLEIPLLDLVIKELPATAVNVSRDVVITDYPDDRPDLARSLEEDNATLFDIPVTAEISLVLGEQVSFKGFGLQADLVGNLNIQQQAGANNLTYGELDILNGSYEIYRQTLEIRQGKLLFFGAYDNPGLDIRAVREAGEITAGVQMNGTLKNISSQLFSTPALADSDIISVLVTGRPFSQLGSQQDDDAVLNAITKFGLERGQGLTAKIAEKIGVDTLAITSTGSVDSSELTVGKYLTPALFVRYGIGLFDSRSKMAVDYNLSRNLILQAETGEFQSVDLTYKVER